MRRSVRTRLLAAVVLLLLCSAGARAQTGSTDIPRHLALARELVAHTSPDDNHYSAGGQFVSFPGDWVSNKYAVMADCSGFVLALFARARYSTESRMVFLRPSTRRRRPAAEDFEFSIENERGFKRVRDVSRIEPGDVLAHALLDLEDQRRLNTTGHVLLIDGHPRHVEPRSPIVDGTEQFELAIIDSSLEWAGPDDSRLADPSRKIRGLGRGTIRIYADANGELVGWARTFAKSTRFFSYDPRFPSDSNRRRAAIGRPVTD